MDKTNLNQTEGGCCYNPNQAVTIMDEWTLPRRVVETYKVVMMVPESSRNIA